MESSRPIEHSIKRPFGSFLVRSIRSSNSSSFHHDSRDPTSIDGFEFSPALNILFSKKDCFFFSGIIILRAIESSIPDPRKRKPKPLVPSGNIIPVR